MANKPVKTPAATKYANNKGVSGSFDHTRNFLTDAGRGFANFGSSLGAFLGSRNAPKYGAGDQLFGIPKAAQRPKAAPQSPYQRPEIPQIQQDNHPELQGLNAPKTFADYLAEAQGMLGAGGGASRSGGVDYSGQISAARTNAGASDARLAAMYSQLQNSIGADAAGIKSNYDTAKASQVANAAAASSQTAQGYQSARDAQTAQFARLGIGDAAGVLAANGGNAARDQAVANSNIAQSQQISGNQTDAHQASALTYNTRLGQAAGAEGTSQRATLQNNLSTKLAQLQSQQAQANSQYAQQGASQAMDLAKTLGDFDNSAAQRRYQMDPSNPTNVKNDLRNQLVASQIQANNLKNQNFQANTASPTAAAQYASAQALAVKLGIDPANSTAMDGLLKQISTMGKINFG